MEPFEWLVLGVGLVVGGLVGANSKRIMRTTARAYLTVGDKTREWSANVREDFQDAIEEARYEREEAQHEVDHEQEEEPTQVDGRSHAPVRAARNSSSASPRTRKSQAAPAEPTPID